MRIALTGDSLITRGLMMGRDTETRDLYSLIRGADVGFTNLETVPNGFVGHPAEDAGGTHLGADEWVLDELSEAGFNLLATANNHSLNYGVEGLLELIAILKRRKIKFAGIGSQLAAARAPAYLDTDAGSIAMLSCSSTFAKGQQASEQRPDVQGRPGLNPLRVKTTYTVTGTQLNTIKEIANELGIERKRAERVNMGFGFDPDDPEVFSFLGESFRQGTTPSVATEPDARDIDAIASWVSECRARADIVIVSLHSHEDGGDKETPAEFARTFCRRMIDEGADLVVGHGPHLLRGMEIYRDRPIFYSLGNFIAQNDLTDRLPADSYEAFRVDRDEHPGEIFRSRSKGGTQGFPADHRYWQTVLPICTFEPGSPPTIEMYPVSLRLSGHPGSRGRPALATGDEAEQIRSRFIALSGRLGLDIEERRDITFPSLG